VGCWRVDGEWVFLDIKALPSASRNRWGEVSGGRLKVKVAAAAEDGKANAELCAFAAKTFGCAKKSISLHAGAKSRLKTLRLPASALGAIRALVGKVESG
jgi:uncharacterized protein (TIGR00251 family)